MILLVKALRAVQLQLGLPNPRATPLGAHAVEEMRHERARTSVRGGTLDAHVVNGPIDASRE